ncbi:MAG: hypothetical protein V3U58_01640 [Thermodesulfobacteriota bacterium]
MIVKSWEELNDLSERALLKARVSHGSTDTSVEISQYVDSEFVKLNDLRNKATGLGKAQFWERMLEINHAYWKYIKVFKDSEVPQDKKMYQEKSRALFNSVTTEIAHIKRDFKKAEEELKIGFGDCLVKAYLLYLDIGGEVWQQPSPEYHSIYAEAITGLEAIKK